MSFTDFLNKSQESMVLTLALVHSSRFQEVPPDSITILVSILGGAERWLWRMFTERPPDGPRKSDPGVLQGSIIGPVPLLFSQSTRESRLFLE
ncbi:hypothetical protein JTB14_023553 [Gonioctena quinquepunctata]|nr:hypothetical protein JTB14_023553 [Gonioctena quinquepunctata]